MARVTALDSTAFITRLYREKNQTGFLKAFSDQPEHITSGMSPLRNILKELQVGKISAFLYSFEYFTHPSKRFEQCIYIRGALFPL
jgi:hypothetical protein